MIYFQRVCLVWQEKYFSAQTSAVLEYHKWILSLLGGKSSIVQRIFTKIRFQKKILVSYRRFFFRGYVVHKCVPKILQSAIIGYYCSVFFFLDYNFKKKLKSPEEFGFTILFQIVIFWKKIFHVVFLFCFQNFFNCPLSAIIGNFCSIELLILLQLHHNLLQINLKIFLCLYCIFFIFQSSPQMKTKYEFRRLLNSK